MSRTTWNSELKNLVQQRWRIGDIFRLSEVYQIKTHFQVLYPNNLHLEEKLQQRLQNLRDEGVVEFVDYQGNYRRIG
jgi:hypothetical protein